MLPQLKQPRRLWCFSAYLGISLTSTIPTSVLSISKFWTQYGLTAFKTMISSCIAQFFSCLALLTLWLYLRESSRRKGGCSLSLNRFHLLLLPPPIEIKVIYSFTSNQLDMTVNKSRSLLVGWIFWQKRCTSLLACVGTQIWLKF